MKVYQRFHHQHHLGLRLAEMARQRKEKQKADGPYLATAVFCETTIEDKKDSALSAIRIIDQINVVIDPSAPPDFPSETNRLPVQVNMLVSFKTGDSPGEHVIRLVMESPSGKANPPTEMTITFTPQPNGGANLRIGNIIHVQKGGLFLMHVFLDGRKMTTMPLQISVQRVDSITDPSLLAQLGLQGSLPIEQQRPKPAGTDLAVQ